MRGANLGGLVERLPSPSRRHQIRPALRAVSLSKAVSIASPRALPVEAPAEEEDAAEREAAGAEADADGGPGLRRVRLARLEGWRGWRGRRRFRRRALGAGRAGNAGEGRAAAAAWRRRFRSRFERARGHRASFGGFGDFWEARQRSGPARRGWRRCFRRGAGTVLVLGGPQARRHGVDREGLAGHGGEHLAGHPDRGLVAARRVGVVTVFGPALFQVLERALAAGADRRRV